ncbi:hypothetical protein MiTe_00828 [Microcystis aeruginosa NIES-2520]|jgi:uncharacterized membrane protein|uniref:Uncharacterized protein n=1 Tax=Microcystis aeruginosa NIES-2520 TaxID=2303982 RepID=A0A5A5RLJ3_MICAE|nr:MULTISPECIES: hypothetical protein [Microcystis]NCR74685.1 hypothetical protein [Microcystis aeruginosa K13-06]MCA2666819.1 hypothetical protein [Microcystis sp. M045S2]MCA2716029.1 hypothetical protein [Microcystis sp. M172S2]MCA2805628.1 hypothetical protein [Microcystis sp. M114S2]MCA2833172.1 hypothetical protein [Microcystis sp. M007S1]
MSAKQNFVFVFIWVINLLLAFKLYSEQASVVFLAVLVLTTFLLILTLKANSSKEKRVNSDEKSEQKNAKQDSIDWHSILVFFAIFINNVVLFWKLFSSPEPQAGILITIAIMAALLLLTLGLDNLGFQNKFPFVKVK